MLIKDNRFPFLAFFWIGIISINLIIGWHILQKDDALYTIDESILFIIISNIFLILTSSIFILSKKKSSYNIFQENKEIKTPIYSAFYYALFALLSLIAAAGGIEYLSLRWDYLSIRLDQSIFKYFIYLFSFLSISYLYNVIVSEKKTKMISFAVFLIFLLIIAIFLIMRVKLLVMIVLLVIFAAKYPKKIPLKNLFLIGILGVTVYLLSMTIRWSGDLTNLTINHFIENLTRVLNAGIERRLYTEYQSVFNYYTNNDFLLGDTYWRLATAPLEKMGLDLKIENPIYQYYRIAHNTDGEKGVMLGSSHPSIYGDSFANFGWCGILIPSIFYIMVNKCSYLIYLLKGKVNVGYLAIGLIIFLILSIRGSIYYSLLYFFIFLLLFCITSLRLKIK